MALDLAAIMTRFNAISLGEKEVLSGYLAEAEGIAAAAETLFPDAAHALRAVTSGVRDRWSSFQGAQERQNAVVELRSAVDRLSSSLPVKAPATSVLSVYQKAEQTLFQLTEALAAETQDEGKIVRLQDELKGSLSQIGLVADGLSPQEIKEAIRAADPQTPLTDLRVYVGKFRGYSYYATLPSALASVPPLPASPPATVNRHTASLSALDGLIASSEGGLQAAYGRLRAEVTQLSPATLETMNAHATARGMQKQGFLMLGSSDGYGMSTMLELIASNSIGRAVATFIEPDGHPRADNVQALQGFAKVMGIDFVPVREDSIIATPTLGNNVTGDLVETAVNPKVVKPTPQIDAAVTAMLAQCETPTLNMGISIAKAFIGRVPGSPDFLPVFNITDTGEGYWHQVPKLSAVEARGTLVNMGHNIRTWIDKAVTQGWVKQVNGQKPIIIGDYNWLNGLRSKAMHVYHAPDRGSVLGLMKELAGRIIGESAAQYADKADIVDLVLPYTETEASGAIPVARLFGWASEVFMRKNGTFATKPNLVANGLVQILDPTRSGHSVHVDGPEAQVMPQAEAALDTVVARAKGFPASQKATMAIQHPHYKGKEAEVIPFAKMLEIVGDTFPADWADRLIARLPEGEAKATMQATLDAHRGRGGSPVAAAPVAAGVAAPKAAAPTAPSAAPSGLGDILGELVKIVAEKTGYAVGEIDPDYELEADLGVDTVKQAEIMSMFREKFKVPKDDSFRLSEYQTIRKLAGWAEARLGAQATIPAPVEVPAQARAAAPVAAGVAAPKAAAPTAPSAAPSGLGDILGELVKIVAEKTGYAVGEIDPDYELEADLGVDTVKQAEIMSMFREKFKVPKDDSFRLSEYQTIRKLAGWAEARLSVMAAAPAPAEASAAAAVALQAAPRAAAPTVALADVVSATRASTINPKFAAPALSAFAHNGDPDIRTAGITFDADAVGIPGQTHCGLLADLTRRAAIESGLVNAEAINTLGGKFDFRPVRHVEDAQVTVSKARNGDVVVVVASEQLKDPAHTKVERQKGEIVSARFSIRNGKLEPVLPDLSNPGKVYSFSGPSSNAVDSAQHPNGLGVVLNYLPEKSSLVANLNLEGLAAGTRTTAVVASLDAIGWHSGLMSSASPGGTMIEGFTVHDANAFASATRLLVHAATNTTVQEIRDGEVLKVRRITNRVTVINPENNTAVASATVNFYADIKPENPVSPTARLGFQVMADLATDYSTHTRQMLEAYRAALGDTRFGDMVRLANIEGADAVLNGGSSAAPHSASRVATSATDAPDVPKGRFDMKRVSFDSPTGGTLTLAGADWGGFALDGILPKFDFDPKGAYRDINVAGEFGRNGLTSIGQEVLWSIDPEMAEKLSAVRMPLDMGVTFAIDATLSKAGWISQPVTLSHMAGGFWSAMPVNIAGAMATGTALNAVGQKYDLEIIQSGQFGNRALSSLSGMAASSAWSVGFGALQKAAPQLAGKANFGMGTLAAAYTVYNSSVMDKAMDVIAPHLSEGQAQAARVALSAASGAAIQYGTQALATNVLGSLSVSAIPEGLAMAAGAGSVGLMVLGAAGVAYVGYEIYREATEDSSLAYNGASRHSQPQLGSFSPIV